MENYSLSDVALATGNRNDMYGMGGGWIIWILLFAVLGGGGFGFGANRGNVATTDEVAAGFNFSGISNKLNELTAGQANINQNLGNAICQLGYQNLDQAKTLSAQLAECCCNTQRSIDSVKFDMANYSAATNAAITAGTQKVLDKICENEKAALQARVQTLELQQALCGVPRINPYGYGVYAYPTYNPCSTGCANI